ncbi:hypothetical protein XI06_24825 [Bradyrhizobium sp. CCBAU 11434]|nr:hypothetical protein [Bradyrhizobium sp. CCBAU 11434]MDA9523411.1 hypothetical protein [Bradyrhizobium sp. CCBAU 11434]
MLTGASFIAELHRDLSNLANAGRSERMAHGNQASVGTYNHPSVDIEGTFLEQVDACPAWQASIAEEAEQTAMSAAT